MKEVMDDLAWKTLLHSINKGDCILMLGPNIECVNLEGQTMTLSNILSRQLGSRLKEPFSYQANLQHIARIFNYDYGRNNLEALVVDFFQKQWKVDCKIYTHLALLPFPLIVNISHDLLFINALLESKKNFIEERFHFRGSNKDIISHGTAKEPVIYNLFGSLREPNSLVLTEDNYLEFLNSIASKERRLPHNISSKLQAKETSFLFIGFDLSNFYQRILMHSLKLNLRDNTSFAFEKFNSKPESEYLKMKTYYKIGFKVEIYDVDLVEFVEELASKHNLYSNGFQKLSSCRKSQFFSPKVFISYANADEKWARILFGELNKSGMTTWLDKECIGVGNRWDNEIQNQLDDSDYFVVIQSRALENQIEGYVNKEINFAINKTSYFKEGITYLIPVRVDDSEMRPELKKFHIIDIREDGGVRKIVSCIMRDFQIRQRR